MHEGQREPASHGDCKPQRTEHLQRQLVDHASVRCLADKLQLHNKRMKADKDGEEACTLGLVRLPRPGEAVIGLPSGPNTVSPAPLIAQSEQGVLPR